MPGAISTPGRKTRPPRSGFRSISKIFGLFLALAGTTGCGTIRYLLQAGGGQLAMINRARPIGEVIRDERTPPRIRNLLAQIDGIKKFGEENSLKPTHNYAEYVHLDRPAAVWVVSASESLRFKSKEWGFPIIGKVPYLGWFDLGNARGFASDLRGEGWDVDVRGAGAYSTLGWFRDPVLSSMIADGEEAVGELINIVLHESVHATLYLEGQAYFNESLASFVGDRLTDVYLDAKFGRESKEKTAYVRSVENSRTREERLHSAYERLNALYASSKPDSEKRSEKEVFLKQLQKDLKFKKEINNATLIQFQAYHSGLSDFDALFRSCQSDWKRFWAAVRRLKSENFSKSQQEELSPVLTPLVKQGC